MWFKKKANISGFNPNTAEDGTDWRTNGTAKTWSPSQTPLSVADAGNYFYLPALGFYHSGQLNSVGSEGYYWSSSAYPWNSNYANCLFFDGGTLRVDGNYGSGYGFRAEVLQ